MMTNRSRRENTQTHHGAYVDIYQAIEEVKKRVPARVVVLWEQARMAEMPALRQLTIDNVRDYMNRVLDFLYAVDQEVLMNVSRWNGVIESMLSELEELEDPGDDYDKTKELRNVLQHMIAYASSALERAQREVSRIYKVDPRGWSDAADDLQRSPRAMKCLSVRDMIRTSQRIVLSQHDIRRGEQDPYNKEEVKNVINTIPASVLKAWREAHSSLSDVMFVYEAQTKSDFEVVEKFGRDTLKFIETAEQMFPGDGFFETNKDSVIETLNILDKLKKNFNEENDILYLSPYIRRIDIALDNVHIYVSNKTNTMKDAWYFTDQASLKRMNITPTQQAEWELVKKRRGPRQLYMEELWQDLYRQERGASRRKSAAQLCAELRRRAGTVIQFDPKLEKDKKELLSIVDEIIKTYTDIYDMSSVVFHALQALTTSPDMPTDTSSLKTILTNLQHSIEQLDKR